MVWKKSGKGLEIYTQKFVRTLDAAAFAEEPQADAEWQSKGKEKPMKK